MANIAGFDVRELAPWDAPALFQLTGDAQTTKYMGFRTHANIAETEQMIFKYTYSPSRFLAIRRPEAPNDILGVVGFEVMRHQATMSIMIRHDRAARGVGRLVGAPFAAWIMSHPQIYRLWSYVHVDNIAGQRVIERSGAVREGRFKRFEVFPNVSNEPQDAYVYAIVR